MTKVKQLNVLAEQIFPIAHKLAYAFEIKDEEENDFSLDDYFNQANEERSSNNPPAYRM